MKRITGLFISTLLSVSSSTTATPKHETIPIPPPPHTNNNAIPPHQRQRNLRSTRRTTASRKRTTSGTFHNLVLLLQFSDHTNRPLPPNSHYDLLYNSPSTSTKVVPTGSVKTYFHTNSYGQFHVQTTVLGWITLSQTEAYYANGDYGFVRIQEAIVEGLNEVQRQGYKFTDWDANRDGVVDGFGMLLSGYGAEFAGSDCDGATNLNRIWSHKGGVDWVSDDGVRVDRYYVSSGLRNKCGSEIARMGVICHELGHYIGLPDLYDNTFEGSGIGALDVMSQSWGWDGTGVYPPLLSAWSKVEVGWVVPTVIEEDGTFELEDSESSDKVYRIDAGFPEGEYLLLENRQPSGFDSEIPHGGIAIWHVDENASQNTRGYPGQDSWPENGNHYRIALLPADGSYDLEKGTNQGDAHDLWHASAMKKELNVGGAQYPNTDSYQGGVITKTGIRIYGFGSSKDKMTFKVEGLRVKKPTDLPSSSPTKKPVTEAPSKLPTFSPTHQPVTDAPTALPTSQPSSAPTTQKPVIALVITEAPSNLLASQSSSGSPVLLKNAPVHVTSKPSTSPTSETDDCINRCFEPIPSSECPLDKMYVNCKFSPIGRICYTDGICGTDPNLANCNGFGAYRRVDCALQSVATDAPTALLTTQPIESFDTQIMLVTSKPSTSPTSDTDECANRCFEPIPSYECPLNKMYIDCKFSPIGRICYTDGICGTNPDLNNCNGFSVYKRVNCNDLPSKNSQTPTNKPTILYVTGDGPYISTFSDQSTCKYYPGWASGLNYCINDCDLPKPHYMENNPIFEFESLDLCCESNYQRKERCMRASLDGSPEVELNSSGVELTSVGGQVWSDSNGDQKRDSAESGLQGTIVDLYECDFNTWVKGTRTALDGSYLLSRIPPGKYFLKVTAPREFHFIFNSSNWLDADDKPSIATTPCHDLLPNEDNIHFDVGVVPDSITTFLERDYDSGSNQALPEIVKSDQQEVQSIPFTHSKTASESKVSNTAASSHSKSSGVSEPDKIAAIKPYPVAKEKVQIAPSVIDSLTDHHEDTPNDLKTSSLHSKSFIRGGIASAPDQIAVAVQAIEVATISHQFGDESHDLRVSKEENILLKFDVAFLKGKAPSTAVLRLYSLSPSPDGGRVYSASHNLWNEDIVTWQDAPDTDIALKSIGPTHPNQWVEVDVTEALKLNRDEEVSFRITTSAPNSNWSARYSSQKLQLKVYS